MSIFVEVLLWTAIVPALAAAAYLAALAAVGLMPWRRRSLDARVLRRFAVIVPAHNEEAALPALLASLHAADYPGTLVGVTVVADNCADSTAAVARAAGATAVERTDGSRTGKGYALAYGIASLTTDYDAVVFIDADCTLSPETFRAFNARLDAGEDLLQAHYTMEIGSGSSTRVARELALTLVHLLRPRAKARLRLSAGLKGSGMCLSARIIERYGWTAAGLAEDTEQHARLVLAGERVAFVPEAQVIGRAPAALGDAREQHRRWEAGRAAAARGGAWPLVASGIRRRSLVMVDAAAELLVPPLSAVTALLAVAALAAYATGHAATALAACAGLAALAGYVAAGLVLLRPRPADLARCFGALPLYAAWKLALYARTLISRPARWEPTRRTPAETLRRGR